MMSPLSGSYNCELISEIPVENIERRWLEEYGITWHPPANLDVIQYWKDQSTGFGFYYPPSVAGSENLYAALQDFPWYYMESKWEFDASIELIKGYKKDCKLLEVGVGKGYFLDKAKSIGLSPSGVEMNPLAVQEVRRRGFTVYESALADLLPDQRESWDVICSFQVLEHLPDPRSFLEQALSLLKPGGLLLLSVPNADIASSLDPQRLDLLDQPPHHMGHWNKQVFQSLESFLPVKMIHIACEPLAPYHIDWFVGAWPDMINRKYGPLASRILLNKFSTPVVTKTLSMGLRRLFKGHTILASFEKID